MTKPVNVSAITKMHIQAKIPKKNTNPTHDQARLNGSYCFLAGSLLSLTGYLIQYAKTHAISPIASTTPNSPLQWEALIFGQLSKVHILAKQMLKDQQDGDTSGYKTLLAQIKQIVSTLQKDLKEHGSSFGTLGNSQSIKTLISTELTLASKLFTAKGLSGAFHNFSKAIAEDIPMWYKGSGVKALFAQGKTLWSKPGNVQILFNLFLIFTDESHSQDFASSGIQKLFQNPSIAINAAKFIAAYYYTAGVPSGAIGVLYGLDKLLAFLPKSSGSDKAYAYIYNSITKEKAYFSSHLQWPPSWLPPDYYISSIAAAFAQFFGHPWV